MNCFLAGVLILAVFVGGSDSKFSCGNSGCAAILFGMPSTRRLASKQYIRGCYYTNWSQYRSGIWKFLPEHIEPGMCTHLFFAFASMDHDFKLESVEKNDEDKNGTLGLYHQLNSLKSNQSDLKTMLSFGGYLFSKNNAHLMEKMLENVDNRKKFIGSAIAFVRRIEYDGFDFNWFPENETKHEFVKLVQEFREAIESESKLSKLPRLLLTAGIPPGIERIADGYDGKALSASLDWMNVMAFDYHGSWENKTGFNAPLFDRQGDGVSINSTMHYLVHDQSIPKEKLVVGFPAYGRGWRLSDSSSPNSIPSPAVGPSPAQPFTLAEGVAAYFEICSLIEKENFVVQFDPVQKVPFIFKDRVWISYDNKRSYEEGLDWLIDNEFAGAFVWALDMDDFRGHCGSSNGTYPLVKTIRSKLSKE
jgi:chitinase